MATPETARGIVIRGAREHNLKNLTLTLPRQKLVVVTGVSGSGKSSLAFDTLYAEGQRRYVESLSAYARQFLGQMEKPDVDSIEGLSPAISIEQKGAGSNPRSTVATLTEIYDYLRLLFARLGTPHCPEDGTPLSRQTVSEMVDTLFAQGEGERVTVLAPIVRGRKGEYRKEIDDARRQGYLKARIDGATVDLEDGMRLAKTKRHTMEIVVDRLTVEEKNKRRLADSLETALRLANGVAAVAREKGEDWLFSQSAACVTCGRSYDELAPRLFSFNSPYGACKECDGLGTSLEVDAKLVIPDASKSVAEGAIAPWGGLDSVWYGEQIRSLAKHIKFDPKTPWRKLTKRVQDAILYGAGDTQLLYTYKSRKGSKFEFRGKFEGVLANLKRRYTDTSSDAVRRKIEGFMANAPCPACGGARLNPVALSVTIEGRTIADWTRSSVQAAYERVQALSFPPSRQIIADPILKELDARLGFLADVGLGYLTLDRAAQTLAGGEAQRIRLATQIGSRLTGVLYILDEPSIGLHSRDNARLLRTLVSLRELGNTVVVVEHDLDTMQAADWLVDLGPGAGRHGGEIIAQGTPAQVAAHPRSITGQYLAGTRSIPVPERRISGNGEALEVKGARENNLKNIDVRFPLGTFTCVTGVSGSGKSTLVNDILYRALGRTLLGTVERPGAHGSIEGLKHVDKVVAIDQSPIGRTPRSNPATYTGAFAFIRDLFAQLPESKLRGYGPGRFSFNVKGGRCEACEGDGLRKIEMHFLPDVFVHCEVCRGRRYNRETLEVLYKGRSIADVLEMTVEEALEFLHAIPTIRRKLETLRDVGLGYIHLGQSATTLSGGEAQRVKLSTELSKVATGRTVYLLDEPTTGLHFEDVRMLLTVLARLVERGNTVIVIEHNLDVVKTADHVIDLGPEGGDGGGTVVAFGTPEEIARVPGSHTGHALVPVLAQGGVPV
ncbi:MAG: excinuclease ABC subunit UvrA [Candidatus Eiseniibacteriota bacterium]